MAESLGRHRRDSRSCDDAFLGPARGSYAAGEVPHRPDRLAISLDLLDRAAGDLRTEHFAYHYLADCALIRGDPEEAGARYRQSLRAALPLGDVVETGAEIQGVAMSEAGRGNARLAIVLASSVKAHWESLGLTLSIAFWDALLERYLAPARASLGDELGDVRAEGRALAFDDAVALALAHHADEQV
jgi:hypothetical protein